MNIKKIFISIFFALVCFLPIGVSAKECYYKFYIPENGVTKEEERTINTDGACRTYMYLCDGQLQENEINSAACYKGNNVYVYKKSDWDLCSNPKALSVFKFIGNILKVAFIAVPIVLIIMGSIDFMKAVMAGKEDDIKKNQSVFVKRIIAAVIVFFVPIITNILMNTILDQTESNCLTCVLNPNTCNTQ